MVIILQVWGSGVGGGGGEGGGGGGGEVDNVWRCLVKISLHNSIWNSM